MDTILKTKPFSARKVVLISVDSLRADRLNANVMPKLHQLLSNAYRFQHAYTNIPYTGAAHATMLSSLYACNHGKTDNSSILSSEVRSVTQVLKASGFKTAGIVSAAPMRDDHSGFERGFKTYIQDERYEKALEKLSINLSARILRQGFPELGLTKP